MPGKIFSIENMNANRNALERKEDIMLLAIGIILFVLGCCMDSAEDREYRAQKRADERHKELMRMLSEENKYSTPRRTRQVRRRFIQDRNGNLLGEEITEEELED